MDWKVMLILILLGYGLYWYNNPTQGKENIDLGIDKVQSLIAQAKGINTSNCAKNFDPVCFDNVTYDNACMAQQQGIENFTIGVCS